MTTKITFLCFLCTLFYCNFSFGRNMGLMTPRLIEDILRWHNDIRRGAMSCKIAGHPQAAPMPLLTWDEELANKAQKWADQCVSGHDRIEERRTSKYEFVGQNWAGAPSFKIGFDLWFSEYKDYDFYTHVCRAVTCGHYTQLVWNTTREIGCGWALCPNLIVKNSMVCDYGPAGNWLGEHTYLPMRNELCKGDQELYKLDSRIEEVEGNDGARHYRIKISN